MPLSLLLLSCSKLPIPDVIRGLQIVAIESTPADPGPLEGLELKVWVADGQGLGADVLVWVCTPVADPEGGVRCAEAHPEGSTGLPLSLFTHTGRVDRNTGPSYLSLRNGWPLFVSIADEQYVLPRGLRGQMIVGALACAPGICPIIDQIAIGPVSGSDAWEQAEGTLADLAVRGARSFLAGEDSDFLPPEQSDLSQDRAAWLYELPPGQVSLAAKFVPVYLPDLIVDTGEIETNDYGTRADTGATKSRPNHAPSLALSQPIPPKGRVAQLSASDPDGDGLKIRTFVTAGGVSSSQDTGIEVLWHEPVDSRRPADLFVVAEDGRGGTAVWQWGEQGSACPGTVTLALGTPSNPLLPGDSLPLTLGGDGPTGIGVSTRLGATIPWYIEGPTGIFSATLALYDSNGIFASLPVGNAEASHNLGDCRSSWGSSWVELEIPRAQACARAGTLAEAELTIDVPGDPKFEKLTKRVQVVLTAGADAGCELP